MVDLDDLEKKAKAATPGPWWPNILDIESAHVVIANGYSMLGDRSHEEAQATVDFVAAANPQVVLELIHRLRTLEAVRRQAENFVEETHKLTVEYVEENFHREDLYKNEQYAFSALKQALAACEEP